jgi:predicted cupin superfamily sugar epimerase
MSLTVDEIKRLLSLQPHPTCGFFAETYVSKVEVPGAALPAAYGGPRPLASVLYFLVSPERRMELHRIRADQVYHHYLGDPLEVLLLYADGRGEITTVGTDLAAGMRPQLLVPGGTFHVSRVRPGGSFAFLGTTAWPAPAPPDFELGDPARLMAAYPALRDPIQAFSQ